MSSFSASYEGIGEMLNMPSMVAEFEYRASVIRDYAEAIAPVYTGEGEDPHRGRFKASFHSLGTPYQGERPPHARAAGIVWNDDPDAVIIELGGHTRHGYQEGHHTLVRALFETRGGE